MIDLQKIENFNNLELEKQVIYSCFSNMNIMLSLPEWLVADVFYYKQNKDLFNLIIQMEEDGVSRNDIGSVEIGNLIEYAKENKIKIDLKYIATVIHGYTVTNFNINIQKLKELQLKRLLGTVLMNNYNQLDNVCDVMDIMDETRNKIDNISNFISSSSSEMQDIVANHRQVLRKKIENLKKGIQNEVTTGLPRLDKLITGWVGGELIVIGARPSMGKTAVSLQFLLNANKPTLFLSLEMGVNSLMDRFIRRETGFNSYNLRTGRLSENDLQQIEKVYIKLEKENIYIDDYSENGADYGYNMMKSKIKYHVKKFGVKAVFIDYLGLMDYEGDNANKGLGKISNNFKKLAKELDIAIILLHQLNRGVENRSDKRPLMSDLRDSGEIEQDADIIIMLYRDAVYNKIEDLDLEDNTIEFLIRKNRENALGELIFSHNKDMTKIFDEEIINEKDDLPF